MNCADRVACARASASLSAPRSGRAPNNTAATAQLTRELELAQVVEAAGVVPSLVYRYFDSKAGLGSALVDDFFDRLEERASFGRPRRPAQEQIVELVWRQLAAALRFDPDLAAKPA